MGAAATAGVAKVASVVGRSFAYRLLHDIHPIAADRPSLPGQLEEVFEAAERP